MQFAGGHNLLHCLQTLISRVLGYNMLGICAKRSEYGVPLWRLADLAFASKTVQDAISNLVLSVEKIQVLAFLLV